LERTRNRLSTGRLICPRLASGTPFAASELMKPLLGSGTLQRPTRAYRLTWDEAPRAVVVPALAVGLSLAVGWLIAQGNLALALLVCLALPAAFALVWGGPATIAGLLVILTLNGVPGFDLTHFSSHGSLEALDLPVVALIGLAYARYFFGIREREDRYTRRLTGWAVLLGGVWLIALVKGSDRGVPLQTAALFGRDFLFFILLVPVAKALVKTDREMSRFLGVMVVLTTIYALGEIAVTLGALQPSFINDIQVLAVGPFSRVYSNMNDLVVLGFACALAYAWLRRGPRARLATLIAIVCGVAVVLQLTRAIYVGLAAGLVIASAIWLGSRFPLRLRLRRRLLRTGVGLLVFVFVAGLAAPQVLTSSSVQTITNRINEGVTDVGTSRRVVAGSANTVAYREHVTAVMREVLGPHWPLGLGFLHPARVRFRQLPHGSIRNNDTGLYNGLMTIGVIGTILMYVPSIMGLACLVPGQAYETRWDWLRFGAMIWIVSVIVGSLTLVTLFSTGGLALTAVLLGVVFGDARRRELASAKS
jgi:hypothetical protein